MGVTQNWEKASSFPSLCMQVPIPMHTVTYMSSPNTGPVPCPYRLPATPLGPAHILAAAIQDLQGPPHFPPWLQSCPPHHLRRIVPTYLTTESVLPPTHSHLPDPRVSPPKRTKTRTENKIKPTIHGQLSGQNKSREQLPAEGLLPLGEHRPAPVVAKAFPSGRGIHPADPSAGGFNVWRGCATQHAVRSVCQNCWQE